MKIKQRVSYFSDVFSSVKTSGEQKNFKRKERKQHLNARLLPTEPRETQHEHIFKKE